MAARDRRMMLVRGQFAAVEQGVLESLRAHPTPLDHLDAARLYLAVGEPERAAHHLSRARELETSSSASERLVVEAYDHLEHRSPEAASRVLEPVVARGDVPAEVALEAWVLMGQADLACDRAFRASRLAERVIDAPQSQEFPDILGRALLLLAHSQARHNRSERMEPLLGEALELASKYQLAELRIDAANLLAAHLDDLATRDPGRESIHHARAVELRQDAGRTVDSVAEGLDPERRKSYLARRRPPAASTSSPSATVDPPVPHLVATLSEISTLINSMSDLDALLDRVMDIALGIVGAERGLIVMFDPDAAHPGVKIARNLDGQDIVDSSAISQRAIREAAAGREVVTFDTAADPALSQQQSVLLYSIRSLLCFPLRFRDRILGAVYLDNQRVVKVYGVEALEFLRAFTNLAAIAIENSRLLGRLQEENVYLKRVAGERFDSHNIIGTSAKMDRVFRLMEKAMTSTFPVLISGETGSGKEVITRAIHFGSGRRERPLVAQNCAAIPSELLESEMFGYRRGAFTGAQQDKKGLFEAADGGTLFLDEIGELASSLQAKLLRVLQDGRIRRVGETSERVVDVRVISATNRDLKALVEQEKFRLDLYYRLNVIQIDLPPLRERSEDIPLLAQHFLTKTCKEMNKDIKGFSRRAVDQLRSYAWPGNVRELENVVARAVVFCESEIIDRDDLPPTLLPGGPADTAETVAVLDATVVRAREIFLCIKAGQGNFWTIVKKPFLARDLSRDLVKEVLRLALDAGGWKYTRALTELGLAAEEYRRFMNFLAKFNLKVERTQETS